MSEKNGSRSPEEIEADIYQTRAELDDTLHELEARLAPKQFMEMAYSNVRNGGVSEFLTNLGKTVRQHPLPFLVTGIGLGWLMMAQRKDKQKAYARQRAGYGRPGRDGRPGTVTMPTTPVGSPAARTAAASTPEGTVATHAGTTGTALPVEPRPDTVGEATHLGTRQGKIDGDARPGTVGEPTHLGTRQEERKAGGASPDTVGEATHLGTRQGREGDAGANKM